MDARIRKSIAPPRQWMAIAAGLIAAMLVVGFSYRSLTATERTCQDAVLDHRHEVVDGQVRRWLADASAIGKLAARQGIDAATIARLQSGGLHLDQGKLCRLDGRVYLHLVFTDGVER